jgi:hypothetical protein
MIRSGGEYNSGHYFQQHTTGLTISKQIPYVDYPKTEKHKGVIRSISCLGVVGLGLVGCAGLIELANLINH